MPGYRCFECPKPKWFASKLGLISHHQNVHAPKNFPCNYCDKRFSTTYKMTSHQNQVHIKPIKYQCGACNFSRYRKEGLRAHIGKKNKIKISLFWNLDLIFVSFSAGPWKEKNALLSALFREVSWNHFYTQTQVKYLIFFFVCSCLLKRFYYRRDKAYHLMKTHGVSKDRLAFYNAVWDLRFFFSNLVFIYL